MPHVRQADARSTSATDATGELISADVRVGDTVVYSRYGGQEITIDGEDLLILHARDVLLVAEVVGSAGSPGTAEEAHTLLSAAGESLRRMLAAMHEVRAEEAAARRPALLKAMMATGVDPVPAETIEQARRLARQRERLLATGAYTTEALRELRGDASASATRTWLTRRRTAGGLFTVSHDNNTLLPAFELDDSGVLRPSIAAVLTALAPARLDGWATWTWFTSTSSWLGGIAPCEVLDTDPERVIRAASRFAANAA